jgi:serine protease AprX
MPFSIQTLVQERITGELAKSLLCDSAMTIASTSRPSRRKAVWTFHASTHARARRCIGTFAIGALVLLAAPPARAGGPKPKGHGHYSVSNPGAPNAFAKQRPKLDAELTRRARHASPADTVDLIAMTAGGDLPAKYRGYVQGGRFHVVDGYWLRNVPVGLLDDLANDAQIERLTYNHDVRRQDALSSYGVVANALDPTHGIAQQLYPYTGARVRVAIVDSGFTMYPTADISDDRISFVNFVDRNQLRHDGNGHGTHVAGIVAGSGAVSPKYGAGIAPGASVLSLKVLDDDGAGSIGSVLTALDWIYTHPDLNVRVVNLSIGAPVTESYWTDPLALAAKALVGRGITVVAAAGNAGTNADGQLQWGGVTAPGNAPWVLTVCAFSTNGTYDTADDTVAGFSSAGPTAIDFTAKPDICAPGVGIVSLSDPGSTLYDRGTQASPSWLVGGGSTRFGLAPYESLTGTSFATPIVSGAVALMLQANPSLTPNLVKAIMQYTARAKDGVSPLKQGAGFLNVSEAVRLAAAFAHGGKTLSMPRSWAKHIIWGNQLLTGGVIDPNANAWRAGVIWGSDFALNGDNIIWGTTCGQACDSMALRGANLDLDNIIWGTADLGLDNIIWGTADLNVDNIVWGTSCGGYDCNDVVWGSADFGLDNIIWGTCLLGDNIIWGTAGLPFDNIIWGTADLNLDNIIWGTGNLGLNIVWPLNAEQK